MTKEQELYKKWQVSRSDTDLMAVVHALTSVIHKEVNKWATGMASPEALNLKAKTLVIEAIRRYNPNSGTKLSSWAVFYLKKLGRFANTYNIYKVSEDKQLDYNKYLKEKMRMEDDYGGTPTVGMLADSLGWEPRKIINMERQFSGTYNDSTMNTSSYLAIPSLDESDLQFAYDNLSKYEQQLFTLKTGWPTGRPLGIIEIGNRLGKSTGKISKDLNKLSEKVNKLIRR